MVGLRGLYSRTLFQKWSTWHLEWLRVVIWALCRLLRLLTHFRVLMYADDDKLVYLTVRYW